MKRSIFIGTALVLACAIAAEAQDRTQSRRGRGASDAIAAQRVAPFAGMPPIAGIPQPPDVSKIEAPVPVFPKRHLTFAFSEAIETVEISPTALANEPEMLETHRYRATFTLRGFVEPPQHYRGSRQVEGQLQPTRADKTPGGRFGYALYGAPSVISAQSVLEVVPKDKLPPEDVVKWFAAARGYRSTPTGADRPNDEASYTVEVFAPTVERAKELTEGLLLIYDNGVFGRLLQADETFKRQHQALLDWYRKQVTEAEQAKAEREKEIAELKEYEDLSHEVLTTLITQLWQIMVDKAGVEARIKACEKLRGANAEVEKLKTAAEIELTGLQAREAVVKDLVAKGRKRAELQRDHSMISWKVTAWQGDISREEQAVEYYNQQLARYQPFPIVDNKVTIRPVKWQVAKPKP